MMPLAHERRSAATINASAPLSRIAHGVVIIIIASLNNAPHVNN